jgi:class 3 adenylate cyclase
MKSDATVRACGQKDVPRFRSGREQTVARVVRTIKTGATHTEYTPIGHTVNLAARLQSLATGGSTVISDSTRKLVEGYFALRPLGPALVKGISELINVFEVVGLGPLRTRLQRSVGRGLSKFVGRAEEKDTLKRTAARAHSGSRPDC